MCVCVCVWGGGLDAVRANTVGMYRVTHSIPVTF